MSYDIYCYKAEDRELNIDEAEAFINLDVSNFKDEREKNKLVDCLIELDPKLQIYKPDYNEISKLQNISIDRAKDEFNYVELSSPEDDLPFQFVLENNQISISVPYWYTDALKINEIFQKMNLYLKGIYNCVGWSMYDPQTKLVFIAKDFDIEKTSKAYLEGMTFLQKKIRRDKYNKKIYKLIKILVILIFLTLLRVLLNKYTK